MRIDVCWTWECWELAMGLESVCLCVWCSERAKKILNGKENDYRRHRNDLFVVEHEEMQRGDAQKGQKWANIERWKRQRTNRGKIVNFYLKLLLGTLCVRHFLLLHSFVRTLTRSLAHLSSRSSVRPLARSPTWRARLVCCFTIWKTLWERRKRS